MFKIEGNTLYLTRGDTAYLEIDLEVEREIKEMILSVKKDVSDEEYAFQITAIDNKFIFEPKHTKSLDYGTYLYDIQITTTLNEIFTVVEKSKLYIREEVTL